jgi:hypothetical protein
MDKVTLARLELEGSIAMKPEQADASSRPLPPSCLGPDGKLPRMSDEERRQRLESVRRHLAEIEEMTDDDPPGAFEEFLRGLDEGRPHRPMFKGYC